MSSIALEAIKVANGGRKVVLTFKPAKDAKTTEATINQVEVHLLSRSLVEAEASGRRLFINGPALKVSDGLIRVGDAATVKRHRAGWRLSLRQAKRIDPFAAAILRQA